MNQIEEEKNKYFDTTKIMAWHVRAMWCVARCCVYLERAFCCVCCVYMQRAMWGAVASSAAQYKLKFKFQTNMSKNQIADIPYIYFFKNAYIHSWKKLFMRILIWAKQKTQTLAHTEIPIFVWHLFRNMTHFYLLVEYFFIQLLTYVPCILFHIFEYLCEYFYQLVCCYNWASPSWGQDSICYLAFSGTREYLSFNLRWFIEQKSKRITLSLHALRVAKFESFLIHFLSQFVCFGRFRNKTA